MKSEKYWKQLSEEREKYIQSGADETAKKMVRLYDKAASDINEQIKKMFDRFVKTSGLTDEEAERYISKTQSDAEIRKLKILLEKTEGATQKREIKNKITAAAYKSRMTRKEAVLNNIYVLTKNLANEEIERTKALYSKTVKESYYRTVFDVFKGVSAGADFTKLDEKAINKMINVKWYGKNFSERIWKNTDLLASAAQDVISSGIVTGKTYMQMSKEIEELGLGSAKASVRLVRTQVSYFRGQSELQAYREAGFEKYKFVASLKEKGTCDKCGGLDGKVFDIDDARAGKNYNPIHPNCRCTTIAYFGKSTGKRIAQSDGKSYRVPSNMTYKEWKKNYVDNSVESGIIKEDAKAVDEVKEYIKNELGISSVEFTELKNADVVKPIAEKMNSMAKEYRKQFTSIRVIDMGDEITIAETRGDTLVLNSKFMNSKDATLEILKQWEKTNYIPKGCNSIEYVASHEYYHLITQYLIDEPQSEVVIRITRAFKNGCEIISKNALQSVSLHEYVADLLAAKQLTKKQKKLKEQILKILETEE